MAKNIKNSIFHGKLPKIIWKCAKYTISTWFHKGTLRFGSSFGNNFERYRKVTFSLCNVYFGFTRVTLPINACVYVCVCVSIYKTYRGNVDRIASAIGRRMIGSFVRCRLIFSSETESRTIISGNSWDFPSSKGKPIFNKRQYRYSMYSGWNIRYFLLAKRGEKEKKS